MTDELEEILDTFEKRQEREEKRKEAERRRREAFEEECQDFLADTVAPVLEQMAERLSERGHDASIEEARRGGLGLTVARPDQRIPSSRSKIFFSCSADAEELRSYGEYQGPDQSGNLKRRATDLDSADEDWVREGVLVFLRLALGLSQYE